MTPSQQQDQDIQHQDENDNDNHDNVIDIAIDDQDGIYWKIPYDKWISLSNDIDY